MHYAGDQIGSTRRITDSQACGTGVPPVCSPALVARRIYSAFGEPVDTANSGSFNALHYGYAGAYGYEEANANALDPLAQLGWLHVGARYYAPELGRFVQRDPIGIRGGVNVYEYVRSGPATDVDPSGLDRWIEGSLHQSIIYGNPRIGYYRIEIGAYKWDCSLPWWLAPVQAVAVVANGASCMAVGGIGVVTKTSVAKPTRSPDIVTAAEEDNVLHKKYNDGDWVYYDIWWRNCNHFVAENQGTGTGH